MRADEYPPVRWSKADPDPVEGCQWRDPRSNNQCGARVDLYQVRDVWRRNEPDAVRVGCTLHVGRMVDEGPGSVVQRLPNLPGRPVRLS